MQKDYTIFQIPSFKRGETYNFDAAMSKLGSFETGKSAKYAEIYRELNDIAEEIEKCRLRNS